MNATETQSNNYCGKMVPSVQQEASETPRPIATSYKAHKYFTGYM